MDYIFCGFRRCLGYNSCFIVVCYFVFIFYNVVIFCVVCEIMLICCNYGRIYLVRYVFGVFVVDSFCLRGVMINKYIVWGVFRV